jgi:trimeric autotransporter adhesin
MRLASASTFCLTLGLVLLNGCTVSRTVSSGPTQIPAGRQGIVRGGQQPVSGATVQLYAVGTAGDGSAATPLLSPVAVTDANGGFGITGTYTCPSPGTLTYIAAAGGNPGLGSGTNNANLVMMAALGPCGNLNASTYIVINELTTVAAVYALAPFMTSATAVGTGTNDATALASAFTFASELVNTNTGSAPGASVPAEVGVPVMQINLLGDIVAPCVNSAGGTAGDTTACGQLFTLTTPPAQTPATNTTVALLHLADNPTLNTNALFSLTQPDAPFQPTAAITPGILDVSLSYPSALTISPSSLDFGSVTNGFTSNSQNLTLANNSANAVRLVSFGLAGSNAGDFSTTLDPRSLSACGYATLFPGQGCSFSGAVSADSSGDAERDANGQ